MPSFLFDIGKVLLDFDFEGNLRRLVPPDHPDPDALLRGMLAHKDPFERGDLNLDQFLELALPHFGPDVTADDFIAAWRDIFTPNQPMWNTVRRLAADGHRLYFFSNINPIHWPWLRETYDIFRVFHDGTCSHEVGAIKPEPESYELAIRNHGLDPAETLYIDDLGANIDGGRRAGFRCHHYDLHDHQAFETWLAGELGSSAPD